MSSPNARLWQKEYEKPQLVTLGEDARKDLRDYVRALRKAYNVDVSTLNALDLGCGTGRNSFFLAEHGAEVHGIDIASRAIEIANERQKKENYSESHMSFRVGDMGATLPYSDASFTLVLDVMSSNALNEHERATYLAEVSRVLTPGGHFFYRGLCKDGDAHVKNLLYTHPGHERDTYVLPGVGVTERVFSEKEFREMYGAYFTIGMLIKKTNYAHMHGRVFKRNYWVAYMQKKI